MNLHQIVIVVWCNYNLLNIVIWMLRQLVVGALLHCHTRGGCRYVRCWNRRNVVVHCCFIVMFLFVMVALLLSMLFLVLFYVEKRACFLIQMILMYGKRTDDSKTGLGFIRANAAAIFSNQHKRTVEYIFIVFWINLKSI